MLKALPSSDGWSCSGSFTMSVVARKGMHDEGPKGSTATHTYCRRTSHKNP